jgi:hypothetical protein
MVDHLKLSGDEPVPSTDEDSMFVGKNNAKGVPDDDADPGRAPTPVMTIPSPGGGGAYAVPNEDVADVTDDDES